MLERLPRPLALFLIALPAPFVVMLLMFIDVGLGNWGVLWYGFAAVLGLAGSHALVQLMCARLDLERAAAVEALDALADGVPVHQVWPLHDASLAADPLRQRVLMLARQIEDGIVGARCRAAESPVPRSSEVTDSRHPYESTPSSPGALVTVLHMQRELVREEMSGNASREAHARLGTLAAQARKRMQAGQALSDAVHLLCCNLALLDAGSVDAGVLGRRCQEARDADVALREWIGAIGADVAEMAERLDHLADDQEGHLHAVRALAAQALQLEQQLDVSARSPSLPVSDETSEPAVASGARRMRGKRKRAMDSRELSELWEGD